MISDKIGLKAIYLLGLVSAAFYSLVLSYCLPLKSQILGLDTYR